MKLALLVQALRSNLQLGCEWGWGLKLALLVAMAAPAWHAAADGKSFDKKACTYKGKKLYGKIQLVTSFPDVKVQEVTAFPGVKVEKVKAFPDKCGQWQIVTAFPDTKVQIVTSFPDVNVQYVTAFPGAP